MSARNAGWKKELAPYLRSTAPLRKDQAALLIVDMQNYFRSIAKDILSPLQHLIETCRKEKVPVLFTAHGHEDPARDGGMLGEWWPDLIRAGTQDAEIVSELTPKRGEKIISKNRYNAFFGSDLDKHLRSMGVKDLIVSGVMTNLCCETTARDAFVRDYRVYFLADGTATADEEMHLATLKNLAFGFAYIVSCGEMEKAIS